MEPPLVESSTKTPQRTGLIKSKDTLLLFSRKSGLLGDLIEKSLKVFRLLTRLRKKLAPATRP